MTPEILAVIPVSGKDPEFRTGIPKLARRSVLEYTFDAVRHARLIGRVVVSTDDQRIARASRAAGIEVPFLRSSRLRRVHVAQILKDTVDFLEARDPRYRPEWIVRLQVTFPFREPGLIDRAVKTVLTQKLDSAFVALPEFDTFWHISRHEVPERITTDTSVPRDVRAPIYRELGGLFSMVHRSILADARLYGRRLGIIPVRSPLSAVDLHATRGFEFAATVASAIADRNGAPRTSR